MPGRPTLRSICLFTATLLLSGTTLGQGFAAFNGRNHPELDWKVAETKHFRVMYPARLAGIEQLAATIAEESYGALSANLEVSFDEPIRIYLSDEDEITNGFASRLGDGWTNIWVHTNDATGWTGPESWLRRVISHELAHIFHYRAVRSNIGLFDYLFANPLPRFWTEGLAQYQTESWDAFRGETWLRTAVLDDKLSYRDGRSAWNGRLLYAVGNSQVRFLADTYGDTTLTKILRHRKPALFGLARVHDFGQAFRSVTGETYRDFYDRWRRHVNIYYNTLAGQQQSVDSLRSDPHKQPGQYIYDVRALPNHQRLVLYLESVKRPVRRLAVVDTAGQTVRVLAEGAIQSPVSTTLDGRLAAFSRRGRARAGSLLYDVYLVNTIDGRTERLTRHGRTSSPALSPDGSHVAYVRSSGDTSSVFLMSLATRETRVLVTQRAGQISDLSWHPTASRLAYYLFNVRGQRRIGTVDVTSGASEFLTDGQHDDRHPVWSPDGSMLGFTSLRDGVPNVFTLDPANDRVRRVTQLATGAMLADWTSGDSLAPSEQMILIVRHSKESDRMYSIDASTSTRTRPVSIDPAFSSWTTHTPPAVVPPVIEPDPDVVLRRRDYNTWKNITHVASIGLPYFNSTADWGLGGGTLWIEPLGKHLVGAVAGVSVADIHKSFFGFTYVNNQLRPSIAFSASRFPDAGRPYGEEILREDRASVGVAALFPLDWFPRPYTSTQMILWAEHIDVTPLNASAFVDRADGLPVPEAGRQTRLRVSLKRKTLRPFRDNQTHPLDGWGFRTRVTFAIRDVDRGQTYARLESSAYAILPSLERHRLFIHGRYRGQTGTSLPQDFVGLSRYDAIRVDAGGLLQFRTSESDRVRGYRRIVIGANVLFGSAEYRIPLVPSLRTEILGLVRFGATVLAPFFDVGYVWSRPNGRSPVAQYGAGIEIKNSLELGGLIELTQSIGFAQPTSAIGSPDTYEIYYRIQSALPF